MDGQVTGQPVGQVYKAICAVQRAIAKEGIAKERRNEQQGYKFRGIDDIYNAMAPILAEHNLCILPRYVSRTVEERLDKNQKPLFYVSVEGDFCFLSAEDGSSHTCKMWGEAMDYADKATNKAMSAAYKYAVMQTFCVPTEGDNDADGSTPEPAPRKEQPLAFDVRTWGKDYQAALAKCSTPTEVQKLAAEHKAIVDSLPEDWKTWAGNQTRKRLEGLQGAERSA